MNILKPFLSVVIFLILLGTYTFAGVTKLYFTYLVTVEDPSGNPVSGVSIRLAGHYSVWELDPELQIYMWQPEVVTDGGLTDNDGFVLLEASADISAYYPDDYRVDWMSVGVNDEEYTVISSQNTTSGYTYDVGSFVVVYDLDGDAIDDNLEVQLAEKFSPVLHKHSWEKQQGLSNVDWILSGRSTLDGYNILGQSVYSATISSPSQLHVYSGTGDRDTFGEGEMWTYWRLDIHDAYRYQDAPVSQRPLYYHVYEEGGYYYVQYWYFFNMNDIIDRTVNDTWHEGDFEHISIKVNSSYNPVAINFYRHEGGRTIDPANCWWSSSNNMTYTGLQQGYSTTRTHIHIWIAANSHASYNRYDVVQSTKGFEHAREFICFLFLNERPPYCPKFFNRS